MNYLVIALVILLFFCFCGSREGFVDFGFSGWHKPVEDFNFSEDVQDVDLSTYTKDLTEIPTAKLDAIAQVVKAAVNKITGKCMQPIETIYINKYTGSTGDAYDARFMFFDHKHSFVAEILAKVLQNKGSDEYTIASVRTQVPAADISGPAAYGGNGAAGWVEYPQILKDISPSKDALAAVTKSLQENQ